MAVWKWGQERVKTKASRAFSIQQAVVLWHILHHPETHGYAITKATNIKGGTLYPMLERFETDERVMLQAEWVMPNATNPSPKSKGTPKRVFLIPEEKQEDLHRLLNDRFMDYVSEGQDGAPNVALIETRRSMLRLTYGIDWDDYGS